LLIQSLAHATEEDWSWLSLQGHSVWLQRPALWQERQQLQQGLVSLKLEDPSGRVGVMVWGGDLGRDLDWRQLAELWRKNASHLDNLQELQPAPQPLISPDLFSPPLDLHLQEYLGQVADLPSRTWLGYLTQGRSSFVLMGLFPQQDSEAAALVRRVFASVRLSPPPEEIIGPLPVESLADANGQGAGSAPPESEASVDRSETGDPEQGTPELPGLFHSNPEPEPEPEPESESAWAEAQADTPLDGLAHALPESPLESLPEPQPESRPESLPEPFARLQLFQDEARQQLLHGPLPRDIKQLFAQAEILQLEPSARLRAEWYYLDGHSADRPFVIDEQPYSGDSPLFNFSLQRPDNSLFPQGNYRLLLTAGEQVAAADFYLRDPTEAELLVQALAGRVEGQFGLYAYLQMGQLQQVTEAEALDWLIKAAHQGLAIAQHQLGLVYFEGHHGQAEDKVLAMDWFRRAALQDYADAAYYMARGYREGLGVPRDLGEALAWTRRGAELGNPAAQYNLALHYLLGRGIEANQNQALHWLRRATSLGYAPAQEALGWLEAQNLE
jgi:TPR repeat protein